MKKIILVDDEPLALERLRNLIPYDEYEIIGEYRSAMEAIAGLNMNRPDIVITDICMARMDGLDMIGKMQRICGIQIGFIIVSGYGQFEYARKALKLGVGDYLLKPVLEQELAESLKKVSEQQDQIIHKQITSRTEISKEKMSKEIKAAEKVVGAVLDFREDQMERFLEEMEGLIVENNHQEDIWNRIGWIIFTLLDSRMGNQNHEFLAKWQDFIKQSVQGISVHIREKLVTVLRECMLIIMEQQGYHNAHAVEYMKLYIRQNFKQDISLGWFADKLYVNAAYLGQKFKKETNKSVNSYLHRIRIIEAKNLAEKTNMTWREIADEVGYKSYLSFFENFIKLEGRSPSDYR